MINLFGNYSNDKKSNNKGGSNSPISEGEEYDVKIEDTGRDGMESHV